MQAAEQLEQRLAQHVLSQQPGTALGAGSPEEDVQMAPADVKGLAQQLRSLLRLKEAGNRSAAHAASAVYQDQSQI
jgi:hypothetical protein